MPELNGQELAKEILALRADIPIVLCTGYSSGISESAAKEVGIREFVMKPIVGRELCNLVRRLLDS